MSAQPEALLQEGRLEEALQALQEQIRGAPAKADLRVFLFQLLCIMGQWDRAAGQLGVLSEMADEHRLLAQVFGRILACEKLRRDVFAGKRSPMIFGEPEPWLGLLAQGLSLAAQDNHDAAAELITQAFEQAPATSGRIDDQPFEWLADADSRLGPVLEVIVDGNYYWLPICRICQIRLEEPMDLRDLVWAPSQLTLANGGQVGGVIPVRYPGTETSDDGPLRLARRTEWLEPHADLYFGYGQRVLATDIGEYPLLATRRIDLDVASASGPGNSDG